IALTATATEDVRLDIIERLGLNDPTVVVTGFDRPNLAYESRRTSKVSEKDVELLALTKREAGSLIVYCSTRKKVDEVADLLTRHLPDRKVFAYHAGMDQADRTSNQEKFMSTAGAIAVATNAFGMGINKPDIRLVIHYNMPGTLEAYYQEAGRAGRDGRLSRCVMLFSYQDRFIQEFFIDKMGEESAGSVEPGVLEKRKQFARDKLDRVITYAQSHMCRRQMILDYFGDATEVTDCQCDICRRGEIDPSLIPAAIISDEVTTLVRQILSAIARLRGKFGVGVVAEVLTGAQSERLTRWQLDQLTVFGLMRLHTAKRVIAMLHRIMEAGLAKQRDPDGVKFRPVIELTAAGIAVMKGEAPPPVSLADLMPRPGTRASGTNPRALGTNPRGRRARSESVDEDESFEQVDPETLERFERLRAARTVLARERQLPPYCICHDRTLKLIARSSPSDLQSLEQVKGMGPMKVKMYGEALLSAMRERSE
ncbi:MAG: ATP-dependent DNA helicase RecQ, partial [Anaerolineae bacterium]|nr:ATP-dependent DNA helicase RecQ [Phycisphaerae bacterium]